MTFVVVTFKHLPIFSLSFLTFDFTIFLKIASTHSIVYKSDNLALRSHWSHYWLKFRVFAVKNPELTVIFFPTDHRQCLVRPTASVLWHDGNRQNPKGRLRHQAQLSGVCRTLSTSGQEHRTCTQSGLFDCIQANLPSSTGHASR